MRIAVMGAGSLGTILGALLTKNGIDVDLIDANAEHVRALNEKGAKVVGKMDFTVSVSAMLPEDMQGEYDCILYLVKATHDEQALPFVLQHLAADGMLVTMQNGIPEERIAKVVGKERTLGCAIGWGANWIEPGVSSLLSETSKMTYDIGELDGQTTPRLESLIKLLEVAGIPERTENLIGLRWTKLTANATFSGMSTVLGGTYGDVLENPRALLCAATIGKEAVAVLRASGITPQPIQGFDVRYLDFYTQKELDNILPVYGLIFGPHRFVKASMLQDLEKGQACEIQSLNGAICDWAVRYNVPVPVNDQVVAIIKAIEKGELKPGLENLSRITLPELPVESEEQ